MKGGSFGETYYLYILSDKDRLLLSYDEGEGLEGWIKSERKEEASYYAFSNDFLKNKGVNFESDAPLIATVLGPDRTGDKYETYPYNECLPIMYPEDIFKDIYAHIRNALIFAQSDIGGSFGTAMKATGYDGIIFTGQASILHNGDFFCPDPIYNFCDFI